VVVKIVCRELTPERWPDLERLFGARGACGGCWCMWWRVPRGGQLWEETKGAPARRQFRARVLDGAAHGVIAYDGQEPVGWCTLGPRADFPRLETVRAWQGTAADGVWSIPCFFVVAGRRGQGVSRALLAAALRACRRRGARTVEGYPVTKQTAAAFAWTGPLSLFEAEGFARVDGSPAHKPLVRLKLV
jgi:GNAT superfamily N-acetyltransferase